MTLTQQFTPTIQQHLDAADRLFDAGDELRGSWELWEASRCALRVVAEPRGWPCAGEEDYYAIVNRLAATLADPYLLQAGLGAPLLFRDNAEYDFLEHDEIAGFRRLVPEFIGELLDLMDAPA